MSALSGMTGFGRADGAYGDWRWMVEARSVNGRSLEVRFKGPQGFEAVERSAKAMTQARMARGQVTIGLQARRDEGEARPVVINEDVLRTYLQAARRLEEAGAAPATADGLLALRGVLDAGETEEDPDRTELDAAVEASMAGALDALVLSRRREGEQLAPLLTGFIDRIEELVARAEHEAEAQIGAVRERFTRRMADLAPDAPGLEERIFLEAAALAAKADVREELDRLGAHIASARTLLCQPPAGRKLDFLMQEFMREANTLCSKSATTALTAVGLELKAVVEQLREQVQNVE